MIYSITSEMYHRYIQKGSGAQRAYQKKNRFVFLFFAFFLCCPFSFLRFTVLFCVFFPIFFSGVNPDKEKTGPPRDFTE